MVLPAALLLVEKFAGEYAKTTSFYENDQYCYITSDFDTYLLEYICGLILPISAVIAFNTVIFAKVIKRLFFVRTSVTRKKMSEHSHHERKKRVTNAIAIALLLGLTWVFGFLSFDFPGNIVFLSLFCFFNAFQGVAIFYLFCIRQDECRNVWKMWLRKCRREKPHNRVSPIKGNVSMTMSRRKSIHIIPTDMTETVVHSQMDPLVRPPMAPLDRKVLQNNFFN
ncbi:adhesion G protein-coupled receptor L1-like [Anneissia japonica]|uniref:adhesion G protein-coupled receptor L1-like n=1 Tax=Anneissia japonica TaxID=1529436 RepID=UPI0014259780|nr:adhesion G protein-coupled receptor L1-like [Anneissia japonica]